MMHGLSHEHQALYLIQCQYFTVCSGTVKISGELGIGKHLEEAVETSSRY